MAHVTVGTRRIEGGADAAPESPTAVEIQAHWVRIGDSVLDASNGLLSVRYEADGESVNRVTVVLTASSFTTVDQATGP